MKKVVLLTGALAAGLAATSLNANASVPVAPNVQETNATPEQVAEMTYDKYHASVDVALKWLADLEKEFTAAEIDADAKKEILEDIQKRSLELSGYTKDMEKAWHNYKEDATKLTDLQAALAAVTAKLTSGEVVFPTETQIKTNLPVRYNHVVNDWKIYRANVKRGNQLLNAFQDLMVQAPEENMYYMEVDEIDDVKAAKLAVEQAHEKFRLDNKSFHGDRWYLDNANNWGPVAEDHTTKACCVDKEADLEALYQTLVTKKGDFETLLNKYYTAKKTLTSKLETSNLKETATLTEDPANYTESEDGKKWVKDAQQKVNKAQQAADDFIKTYNAANPADWSDKTSADQLKYEDGKAPAFKTEDQYEARANELITAVDTAITELEAAVKEAKDNDKAYNDGLTALVARQNELTDIKTAYAGKDKEFATGKVYEQVIKVEQDKIDKATTDLTKAWNEWTDKSVVPVDPKNAVEHVAGITKDNVIYGQLKQDIAALLDKIQKNETANTKIHEMTLALKGHYDELEKAVDGVDGVGGYEDFSLSDYAADGLCAHGEYLGTTSLTALLDKFIEDEQMKYDAIESHAYLADTTVDGPTAKKDALDHELEMTWNAIATDQCAKYLAEVEAEYNTKHAYCEGLDDKCDEVEGEGAPCTCTEKDREANPCGWCDATARGLHDDIETAKSEMDGKIQDWHFATDAKNHVAEVKTYKDKAFTDIENWVEAFKTADEAHDKKLKDTKAETDNAIHKNLHQVIGTMRLDAANFETGDTAAANLWAKALTDLDLDLDGTADTFDNFKAFVDAVEAAEARYTPKAQELYDNHHWSQLDDLLQSIVGENGLVAKSTYMKAVEANRTAKAALLNQLAQAQATLDAAKNDVIADKNEVYEEDYTALTTTDLKTAQDVLDAQKEAIEEAWKAGKAADHIEVVEDVRTEVKGYALDITKDGKNVIDAYVEKAQAAKDLYATNKLAKEELLVQIQAILTNTNAAYKEVECAEAAGCTQDFRTDLDDLKMDLVGADGNGGIKKEVNNGFDSKFATKTAAQLKSEIDVLETTLGQVKKGIADFNHKVLASADAKADILDKIEKAFGTEGSLMKPALAETGAANFQHVPAAGEVRNTAKYFKEINDEIDNLKTTITNDDSHKGNHSALEKYNTYLQTLADIKADLEELVQAIKDNETAHNAQLQHRDELYKKYECYATDGLADAVNFIADPDFSLDTEFPEVPGYPETAVDPEGKDHTKAHTAVAEAIKALDDEIKKHYENGASNVEAAKTLIDEKEDAYTTAFQHAQTNDSKFMEEYGNCKEADKDVVTPTYVNWIADLYENGDNKYSDTANTNVTNAYGAMVDAKKDYLYDIKTDWYNNKAVEEVGNNEGLLNIYKEKIEAYNTAVEKAQKNDDEFKAEIGLDTTTPDVSLPAAALEIAEYNDDIARTAADTELEKLLNHEADLRTKVDATYYQNLKEEIVQAWEDELLTDKGVAGGKVETLRAKIQQYKDDVTKYNDLVDQINAVASAQKSFNDAKAHVDALEIMNDKKQTHDETPAYAADDKEKEGIEAAATNIQKDIHTLETQIDEWYHNGTAVTATVAPINTAIEDYQDNADTQNGLFVANENAFDGRYDGYAFEYDDDDNSYVYGTHATGASLYDTMLATKAEATDFTAYDTDRKELTGLAFEAFDKFVNTSIKDEEGNVIVKSLVEQLDDEINALVTLYKAEDAASFDVKKYEELKNKIDYARSVAETVGNNLGDVTAEHNTTGDLVNEYDFMYLLDKMILENEQIADGEFNNPGDLDLDGEYTVADLELLDNIIWYKNLDGVQRAQANRGAFEAELNAEVVHNTVAIAIDNNYEFKGLQFDVTVPEGAKLTDLIATTRAQGLVVASNKYAENTYRVVIVGMGGDKMISGNEGNLVSFNIFGAEGEVEIFNVKAANGVNYNLNGASVYVGTTTSIDEVAAEGETDIFSLDGIRQSVMKAGVNIVRGANGVAKKIFNK